MELIFLLVMILTGIVYWNHITVKNKLHEQLLKDFVSMIVPCKVEKRDGYFYVYNGLNSQFLAQCKNANELEKLLPSHKMHMSWDCSKTVFDVINDWKDECTPLKST